MADFPYSPHAANLKKFLEHVQKAGVPDKVTLKYLEKVGFKSSNDRYILGVLKFLGFVDSNGAPSKVWTDYRNRATAAATLATAIQKGYSDLFRTYPDANRKDTEALRNYFSAHTKVAESTLGLIVATFKVLVGMADFESVGTDTIEDENAEELVTPRRRKGGSQTKPPTEQVIASTGSPTVNINIQLQLPATDDATIYEKLFAAMKKNLFP